MQSKFIKEINKMETLNYKVLEGTGYNGYILKDCLLYTSDAADE